MKAHSYFPTRRTATTYAMAGDDVSLHFDLSRLTPKQTVDHHANVALTGLLQVALLCIGRRGDRVAFYNAFREPPWRDLLERYARFFDRLAPDSVRLADCRFYPPETFYAELADDLGPDAAVTLYMASGSNLPIHRSEALLSVSRNVNSKAHFAEHAPAFGLPTPETLVTTKSELGSATTRDFFRACDGEVMLKTLGLAGARNVIRAASIAECEAYLDEYAGDMTVILQRRLDLSLYTEMTADLFVSDNDVRISNVRKILFADGVWVGNLLGPDVRLRPSDEAVLLRVGEYARAQGYAAPEGLNCGVDFFVSDDDIQVTEINARWTGGLFPAQILERAGLSEQTAVAFIDQVPLAKMDAYLDFCESYGPGADNDKFAALPFGVTPFPGDAADGAPVFVWQLVTGDFDAFKSAKRAGLDADVLPTAEKVSLNL